MATEKSDNGSNQDSNKNNQRVAVGVRLENSPAGQPELANYSNASTAHGLVLIDFGFLEPAMLSALAKAAKAGGKVPKAVQGNLAARVVLPPEAALGLIQQLERVLGPKTVEKKSLA